ITDVHEARAQYDSARANTILTRNALEDAYQALAEITGKPVASLKALPMDFKPELPAERDVDGWIAAAIENNPALRAKELQVQAADAEVNVARAGHLPTLTLNGNYGKNSSWGDSTFTSENPPFSSTFPTGSETRGPSFGITLTVPLFSGGATQSRVRQAIAQRDVARDELEQQ